MRTCRERACGLVGLWVFTLFDQLPEKVSTASLGYFFTWHVFIISVAFMR